MCCTIVVQPRERENMTTVADASASLYSRVTIHLDRFVPVKENSVRVDDNTLSINVSNRMVDLKFGFDKGSIQEVWDSRCVLWSGTVLFVFDVVDLHTSGEWVPEIHNALLKILRTV